MDDQQGNEALYRAAYAIGFFLGDGGLYRQLGRNAHRVYFTKRDVECLERVAEQLGERPIRRHGPSFRLEYYSQELYEFLAFNTAFRTEVPQPFFEAPPEVQKELVAGLMDSDGSVTYTEADGRPRWQLQFTSTERKLIDAMRHMLRKGGVRVGGVVVVDDPNRRAVMHLRPNLQDFANRGFYFHNRRKMERLNAYMQRVHASETLYAAPLLG